MGAVYAADANRSCLQMSEERSGHSSDPSSTGTSGGSPYPGRLPGILSGRDVEAPATGTRTWTDTESSAGEASRDPNAGCLFSHHRWPSVGDAALHRTPSPSRLFYFIASTSPFPSNHLLASPHPAHRLLFLNSKCSGDLRSAVAENKGLSSLGCAELRKLG